MATERKNGAGLHMAGVLERMAPPPRQGQPQGAGESDPPAATVDAGDPEQSQGAKGRGGASRKPRPAGPAARKVKGRTIYIPDDLFERILVGAHRRDRTISEYVVAILERQVPDHRTMRADPGDSDAGAA